MQDRAFGVSDGVSGWNDYGFSSNQFSQQLMNNSKKMIEKIMQELYHERQFARLEKGIIFNKSQVSLLEIHEQREDNCSATVAADEENTIDLGYDLLPSPRSAIKPVGGQCTDSGSSQQERPPRKKQSIKKTYDSDDENLRSSNKTNIENSIKSNCSSYLSRFRRLNQMSMKLLKSRNSQNNKTSSSENKSLIRNTSSGSGSYLMPSKVIHPIKIMTQAYSKVSAIGSATALVAIRNGRELKIANLGDSGFLLIRFSERTGEPHCVLKSKEQQHSFNIPFQLSVLPNHKHLEELYNQGKMRECQKLLQILRKKHTVI